MATGVGSEEETGIKTGGDIEVKNTRPSGIAAAV